MALLETDLLVMQQVTSFLRDDFAITDAAGATVGHIHTGGSTLGRMFTGARRLDVCDVDGSVVVHVDDVMTIGRDRFVFRDGNGQELGELVKEFTFMRDRLTLHLVNGENIEITGDVFDFAYEIVGPGGLAAQIGRRWGGIANALLGRDRYVVAITPGVPPYLRAAVVGVVVAIDLVRAKRDAKRD